MTEQKLAVVNPDGQWSQPGVLEHSPCGSESFGEQAPYSPSVMLGKDKRALAGVATASGHNFLCSSEIWR